MPLPTTTLRIELPLLDPNALIDLAEDIENALIKVEDETPSFRALLVAADEAITEAIRECHHGVRPL